MKAWIVKSMIGASLVLAPLFSAHAIEVVESASGRYAQPNYSAQPQPAANNMQMLNQMQAMQDELMRLHGMLDEQQQQIQLLKKQRLDDYKNIDKRLSEIQQAPASNNTSSEAVSATPSAETPTASAVTPTVNAVASSAGQQDILAYQQAYDLIKLRKFDQARDAFLAFNKKYPQSQFVANAHYWLGELYIIEGNYVNAKASFQAIIKQYPNHAKYPEALYKIATVNYELGDRTTAKLQLDQLLSQFGSQSINAVKKARDFLRANYP